MKRPSIGVAIISYKDKSHLEKCLPPLLNSSLKPKVLVFNSTSNDGTVELAQKLGAKTLVIPRNQMNHGWAREISRKTLKTDIVVMMTPDAYPADKSMLGKLVKPLIDGKASIAYARQIPKPDANPVSAFSRTYNYPDQSHVRGKADVPQYGNFTAFCSDSCTAYLSSALDTIGGFRWVLAGEDAIAGAMLIKIGHKIAYVAEAVVAHSHNYGPVKEFCRHFDTGMYRKQWHKILDLGPISDQKRGVGYAKALLIHILKTQPSYFPQAFWQLSMGWLGFQFGRLCYHRAPLWLYKKISPTDFFWNSKDYKNGRWFKPAI